MALVKAAVSGNPRFFLGTDTAPHATGGEGVVLRERRACTRRTRRWSSTRGVRARGRARPARGFREPLRPGLLRPSAEHGARSRSRRRRGRCPRSYPFGAGDGGAAARRRAPRLALRGLRPARPARGLDGRAGAAPRPGVRADRARARAARSRRAGPRTRTSPRSPGASSPRAALPDALRAAARRSATRAARTTSCTSPRRGEVETRPENWHDLFNALAWIAFPQAKAAINAQHAAMLEEGGEEEARRRSPERDALTLFDEGGVVVASSSPALLRAHPSTSSGRSSSGTAARSSTRKVRFLAFGHSLFEKALDPFVGIVAKTVFVPVDDLFAMLPPEAQVARGRRAPRARTSPTARAFASPQGHGADAGARHPGLASRHRARVLLRRRRRTSAARPAVTRRARPKRA